MLTLGDVLLDPFEDFDHVLDTGVGATVSDNFLAEEKAGHSNTIVLCLKLAQHITTPRRTT